MTSRRIKSSKKAVSEVFLNGHLYSSVCIVTPEVQSLDVQINPRCLSNADNTGLK